MKHIAIIAIYLNVRTLLSFTDSSLEAQCKNASLEDCQTSCRFKDNSSTAVECFCLNGYAVDSENHKLCNGNGINVYCFGRTNLGNEAAARFTLHAKIFCRKLVINDNFLE